MKCQKCDKPATFHITELEKGKHQQELHLCEEHARLYLTQSEAEPTSQPSITGALASQLAVGQTAEELEKLDKKACPVCGITFYEFRNQGRLGCPHDYIFFEKELEPLIANIHGETTHVGKRPHRYAGGTAHKTELIRMRREMKEAISEEDYERASRLRDEIRHVEETTQQAGPESLSTESLPTESLPTESLPTESLPTESLPTESSPTESSPTESSPTESSASPPSESDPSAPPSPESPPQ